MKKKKTRCKAKTNRNTRCRYPAVFNGYCMRHFEIDKKEGVGA